MVTACYKEVFFLLNYDKNRGTLILHMTKGISFHLSLIQQCHTNKLLP